MSRGDACSGAERPRMSVMAALLLMVLAVANVAPAARAGGMAGPQPGVGPDARPSPGSDTPPPAIDRDDRPERDADAPGTRPDVQRPRPRQFDDGDRAPRSDEGCPYRGRKLDLIV